MAEPSPYGRSWKRGQSEAGLLGFVDLDDKKRFDEGQDGPFRRVIAPTSWGIPTREYFRDFKRQPKAEATHV